MLMHSQAESITCLGQSFSRRLVGKWIISTSSVVPSLPVLFLPIPIAGSIVFFHMPFQIHGSWLESLQIRPYAATQRWSLAENDLSVILPLGSPASFAGPFSENVGQCGVVGFSVRGAPSPVVDASGFSSIAVDTKDFVTLVPVFLTMYRAVLVPFVTPYPDSHTFSL